MVYDFVRWIYKWTRAKVRILGLFVLIFIDDDSVIVFISSISGLFGRFWFWFWFRFWYIFNIQLSIFKVIQNDVAHCSCFAIGFDSNLITFIQYMSHRYHRKANQNKQQNETISGLVFGVRCYFEFGHSFWTWNVISGHTGKYDYNFYPVCHCQREAIEPYCVLPTGP